jgi:hypothetical protein
MPVAAASAAVAADYDSVDQAIAAAARDGGAPLGLSRLNLVGQVTAVHLLSNKSNLPRLRCLITSFDWRLRRQGRAGKTALARALSGEGFEDTASTVGVEQRLMEVTPAALDVLGTLGVWRRAEGCDSTGAISAAAAAAKLAARKLASGQLPTALRGAGAGAATAGVAGGEISELLEGMDGGARYGTVVRAGGEQPPPREARPIDGMSVEEIRKEFPEPYPDVPRNRAELLAIINCILDTNARIAHRLAQPVARVDEDARAKKMCGTFWRIAMPIKWENTDDEQIWNAKPVDHPAWRAVAAKEAGDA